MGGTGANAGGVCWHGQHSRVWRKQEIADWLFLEENSEEVLFIKLDGSLGDKVKFLELTRWCMHEENHQLSSRRE